MKRLLILSIVALATTSSMGCRTCSSWWNRGSSCDSACVSGMPIEAYSSGGALVAPPTVEYLPGPVEALPRG